MNFLDNFECRTGTQPIPEWSSTSKRTNKREREFDLLNDYKVMKKNFPQESGLQQSFLRLQLSILKTHISERYRTSAGRKSTRECSGSSTRDQTYGDIVQDMSCTSFRSCCSAV
nr:uncharacterized protein LOC124814547 [Hydra vulgaris]